jgi:TonB family protein
MLSTGSYSILNVFYDQTMMKIKINFMDTKSEPSDDEIRSHMNFDLLVENARMQSGRKRMRHVWIALSVALTLVPAWLIINSQQQKEARVQLTRSDHDSTTSDGVNSSLVQPNLTPSESLDNRASVVEDKNGKSDTEQAPKNAHSAYRAIPERSTQIEASNSTKQPGTAPQPASTSAVSDTYVQAEPLDGYTQLYAYFNEHLTYPPQAVKDSVEGIETVSFTIDERGKPTHISITHSLGALFDEEAMRVINKMPEWRPATLNGRPVASQLSVPLTFNLNRIKKP